MQVTDTALEPGLFRVTARWQGDPPPDREALVLRRCAELTVRLGGRAFYVVNANDTLAHAEWLMPQAIDAPVMVIPAHGRAAAETLTALIRVFSVGREPHGYRLYDAERILKAGRA